jgi:alkylation response protein AidB-like acyl-CoA dehydrogenase
MNLALTPQQEEFVGDLGSVLASGVTASDWDERISTAPGYEEALWSKLMTGRWVTVGFPEALGGGGGGVTDMVLMAELLGAGPVPGPLHSGIVLSGHALLAAGDDVRLRALLSGERTFAFCSWGGAEQSAVVATERPSGWHLDGRISFVPYGADAVELLVLADVRADDGTDQRALFAVDRSWAGVATQPIPALGGDRLCHVAFTDVEVPASGLVGRIGDAAHWWPDVRDIGRVVVAAEMVGAASAALAHASRWASTRVQFQAPIGTLQAVQHRLADAFIDVVTARDAVYDAAATIDRGEAAHAAAAGAKAYCGDACRRVTAAAHQVCGGEGIYADQPLQAWHRRVSSLVPYLGGVQELRAVVAEDVLSK